MSTIVTTAAHDVRMLGHFVGGESVAGAPGRAGSVFNPATGQRTARVSLLPHSQRNPRFTRGDCLRTRMAPAHGNSEWV